MASGGQDANVQIAHESEANPKKKTDSRSGTPNRGIFQDGPCLETEMDCPTHDPEHSG